MRRQRRNPAARPPPPFSRTNGARARSLLSQKMIVRVGNDAVDALRATSVNDMLSSAQWGRPKWGGRSFF